MKQFFTLCWPWFSKIFFSSLCSEKKKNRTGELSDKSREERVSSPSKITFSEATSPRTIDYDESLKIILEEGIAKCGEEKVKIQW